MGMDENWTINDPQHVERTQTVWNALQAGDFATALDSNSDDVIFENGPGAGPWRRTEGKEAFVDMSLKFIPIFGETWDQVGTCIFANEQFAVTLVAETGTHAESGDTFDNRAIYVSRFEEDGKADRVWTVDLDSEDMEQFWRRNPPADACLWRGCILGAEEAAYLTVEFFRGLDVAAVTSPRKGHQRCCGSAARKRSATSSGARMSVSPYTSNAGTTMRDSTGRRSSAHARASALKPTGWKLRRASPKFSTTCSGTSAENIVGRSAPMNSSGDRPESSSA